mgnify:CR=1 FL=1
MKKMPIMQFNEAFINELSEEQTNNKDNEQNKPEKYFRIPMNYLILQLITRYQFHHLNQHRIQLQF